jgi:PiT family inorganic phosphate transporter
MHLSLWLTSLASLFAINVAWSMGANDVANSMGTVVGSRVLSLGKALALAGVLEFLGAVLFSQRVVTRLATSITHVEQFNAAPQTLLLGMVAVLLASGLWIQLATLWGIPVSSTHAIVGAITGFTWIAAGANSVNWSVLGQLALAWLTTPLLSGVLAALLYGALRWSVLSQAEPVWYWQEWCPWWAVLLIGVFGGAIAPIFTNIQALTPVALPSQTYLLGTGLLGVGVLTWQGWRAPSAILSSGSNRVETALGRFQIVSSSFVAFAHGANDVGNAIAPFAVIVAIVSTGVVPSSQLTVPFWLLLAGGCAIVAGLAIQGRKVITTVGEEITQLQPSSGFCAELATATSVLLASSAGFPVSTSHALVGSLFGISLMNRDTAGSYGILGSIVSAWVLTVPLATLLGALSYTVLVNFVNLGGF